MTLESLKYKLDIFPMSIGVLPEKRQRRLGSAARSVGTVLMAEQTLGPRRGHGYCGRAAVAPSRR